MYGARSVQARSISNGRSNTQLYYSDSRTYNRTIDEAVATTSKILYTFALDRDQYE